MMSTGIDIDGRVRKPEMVWSLKGNHVLKYNIKVLMHNKLLGLNVWSAFEVLKGRWFLGPNQIVLNVRRHIIKIEALLP